MEKYAELDWATFKRAYDELMDPLTRELYDQPCQQVFGMCGKRSGLSTARLSW